MKDVLDLERENVRRALAQLARDGHLDDAADLVRSLWVYWLTGSYLEGRKAVEELLASPGELSGRAQARTRTVDGLFAARQDAWGEAIVLGALGWLDTGRGEFAEEHHFERAYVLARDLENEIATAHAATNMAELLLARECHDEARAVLDVALRAHEAVRLYDGLSYGLEATARLAWSTGRAEAAACLLGAADWLREEVGVPIWGARLTRFEALVGGVRDACGDEAFAAAWNEGRSLGFDAALEAADEVLHAPAGS